MNNSRRQPRKRIRASKAAEYFSVHTKTFIRRCRTGSYPIRLIDEFPGTTAPILCWQAEVEEYAKQIGIL